MKLTANLKKWIVENCDVKADAADDEFRKAVSEALIDGSLTGEKYSELMTDPKSEEIDGFKATLEGINETLVSLTELIKTSKETSGDKTEDKTKDTSDDKSTDKTEDKSKDKDKTKDEPSSWAKNIASLVLPQMVGDKGIDIRVKEVADSYNGTKSALLYPATTKKGDPHLMAGRPVILEDRGRAIELSQRDKAVSGAYAKWMIASSVHCHGNKRMGLSMLRDHDKELVLYAIKNMEWGGSSNGGDFGDIKDRKLTEMEQKQIIDDNVSGGLEAAPIVFDDDIIQTPLLHGELFPLVKKVNIDRGRRIEGVATGTVTLGWGGIDATAITLFNTAAYVTAFDTTIYRVEGAIQIGLDFLSDTPIDFGQHVTSQYGERLLEELDGVIATGNGTTQPQGIMNSGATAVAFGGVAATIGGYETLRYTVTKPEHGGNMDSTAVFCGTEQSFVRARAIPVGATDERRLFGLGHFTSDYNLSGRSYRINETLANNQIFYAVLGRYRMYIRRGLTMRSSTEGNTLILNNLMLIAITARFGGQMERAAAAALTITAQA
ncbi:hypothetical protein LCGC14_0249330 [marine sediment metagenome]|uniref:Phage capsid-like C-terminal domain-containing protein n=1 Tax=marine sediment metagenome TaxID=412755 RepID=A0A0F9U567_9ZZZZ